MLKVIHTQNQENGTMANDAKAMTPMAYLKQELNVTVSDLAELDKEGRAELKQYACEEMRVLGIPIKD